MMQQETATGGVNVETNYRSGYHRTTRPKQYKDKKTGEYVEAETLPDVEAGAYLMEHRKGWTIYFDEVETWKAIPAEQFKELFLSFNQYAKDFIRKQFPPELWYLQSIYDAKCNSLDRDADKYLDTQALKIKGGRKSAEARAAKKDSNSEPKSAQEMPLNAVRHEPEIQSDDEDIDWQCDTLEDCKQKGYTAYTVLYLYASRNHLWIPTKTICKKLASYPRLFSQQSIDEVYARLSRTFNSETNEAVLDNMLKVACKQWERHEENLRSQEQAQQEQAQEQGDALPPDFWDDVKEISPEEAREELQQYIQDHS